MSHYHIHWSSKDTLDWESFASRAEAEATARKLVRLGETYTIEGRDEACPRCRAAFKTAYETQGSTIAKASPKTDGQKKPLEI